MTPLLKESMKENDITVSHQERVNTFLFRKLLFWVHLCPKVFCPSWSQTSGYKGSFFQIPEISGIADVCRAQLYFSLKSLMSLLSVFHSYELLTRLKFLWELNYTCLVHFYILVLVYTSILNIFNFLGFIFSVYGYFVCMYVCTTTSS